MPLETGLIENGKDTVVVARSTAAGERLVKSRSIEEILDDHSRRLRQIVLLLAEAFELDIPDDD